jgi:CO dehydrogenase nickel-insertion accessory protein CooC1
MSILVDLNGTIAYEGKPIQKTIDYLQTVTEDIYVISGSTEGKRQQYERLLKKFKINYVTLILNPIDQDKDIEFKIHNAQKVPNITLAIDNNPKIIQAYISLGINTIHPNDL